MACTTILVGRKASYDGSTMIARNDDSGSGHFTPKKFVVVPPQEHPAVYWSVLSHVEVELPGSPMRMTAMPNAVEGKGIWAAGGVNEAGVGMTATETITSNPRVLGADPLVEYIPAKDGQPEVPGGIGEEDIVYLVLPYIHTAREGVLRLGKLLEKYGTYEMNGIAFQDVHEIWWLETIGGHHWIAKRVPDDAYVVMPNQLGIDQFDLEDALGAKKNHLCSADLDDFIENNHLDLSWNGVLNPRDAFGSHDDSDHVYNTPRAWFMLRYLNPHSKKWDGPNADYTPRSDDLPWCMVPEKKITPGKTLIFLDEIQECQEAITSLKFWAIDNRYDVIVSGSLLGIDYKRASSYPVGYVDYLKMYGVDFEEVDKIQRSLLQGYLYDIAHYATAEEKVKAEKCYLSLAKQLLDKENHKFQYKEVEHGGRAQKYFTSIEWLLRADMVHLSKRVTDVRFDLDDYAREDFFRAYATDLSLLMAMKDFSLKQHIVENTLEGNSKGGIYECAIADALYKKGYSLYFYKNETSKREIDIIIQKDGKVVPIEVKSGNTRATSLQSLLKNKKDISFGYKFADGNIGVNEDGIITLPLYMITFV